MFRKNLAWLGAALLLPALASAQGNCTLDIPQDNPPVPGLICDPVRYSGVGFPPRVISLTYDDGPSRPSPATTLRIASYLRDQGIRATFFVETSAHHTPCPTGCACPGVPLFYSCACHTDGVEQPDLTVLSSVATWGHRNGNHTMNHERLDIRGTDVKQQICGAQQVVDLHVTDGIYLLRPPGGGWGRLTCPYYGFDCQDPADVLRSDPSFNRIVGPVNWNLSITRAAAYQGDPDVYSSDWDCAKLGHTPQHCGDRLLALLDQNPTLGGTVLLHDWIPISDPPACGPFDTSSPWAAELTEYLVPRLKQRGYLILPLDGDKELPGGLLFEKVIVWTTNFSDSSGFGSDEGYYGTFRLGDLDGDGRADVCARGILGMYCNLSTGTAFSGAHTLWDGGIFSNQNGWLPPYHSTTIQLGDVTGDGKADACGLGANGTVFCARSTGASFVFDGAGVWRSNLPAVLYQNVGYYGTVRLADVTGDGKADLCYREPQGLFCAASTGTAFAAPALWSADYGDTGGWLAAQWSTTTQLADLNGDGRDDVCVRGAGGLYCATSTGGGFNAPSWWSAGTTPHRNFSDGDGFGSSSGYYRTLRLGDLDGDGKADACIRSIAGVLCAKSTGTAFETYRVWQKVDFRDDLGWLPDKYSATVMLGDVTGEGKADLCARRLDGVVCAVDKD